MDSRAITFLEAMAAIGILALVAFLIYLVARPAIATRSATAAMPRPPSQWVALLLAAAATLACAIVVLWQMGLLAGSAAREGDADARGLTFFAVMMIIGAVALVVFLIAMPWRDARGSGAAVGAGVVQVDVARPVSSAPAAPPVAQASHETPSVMRLLGLVGLGVAFLVVNWSAVPHAEQHALMLHLVYPAGFIVALVMMFDKASRAWNVKPPAETFREWLYCDALLTLFLFGYLNLLSVRALEGAAEAYRGLFWDFLHVAGLLLVIWVLDRKAWRLRILLANAWLLALPILLLIWRNVHGVELAEPAAWWGTIWPVFFLALAFFVLEVIVLVATRDTTSHGIGIAKDLVFMILYVIFLVAGRPAAGG